MAFPNSRNASATNKVSIGTSGTITQKVICKIVTEYIRSSVRNRDI